jgi:hypothetical protein
MSFIFVLESSKQNCPENKRYFLVNSANVEAGCCNQPLIPVVVGSNAWVYGSSLVRTAVSNPAGGMDVCLSYMICGL